MNRKLAVIAVVVILSLLVLYIGLWQFYFSKKFHDIEILGIEVSSRLYINYANEIIVSVENNGDESESFNVTLYGNDTVIDVETVENLAPRNVVNLTFKWNTTGLSPASYVLKAEADVVPGETNVENNVFQTSVLQLLVKPTLSLSPLSKTVHIGENFTLEVTISDVVDLYGWEFKLGWNASLLEVVSVEEGGFLKSGGETFFLKKLNASEGFVHVYCTLLGNVSGVSGGGTLLTVEFNATGKGECDILLDKVNLGDSLIHTIPCVQVKGHVTIENPGSGNSEESSSKATLYVNPNFSSVSVGESFSITVELSNVTNLCGYDFKLSYNSTVLNATHLCIAPIFDDATQIIKEEINATLERIWVAVLSAPINPINGTYVLVTINFTALTEGVSSLTLYETKLGDDEAEPIPHDVASGQVSVVSKNGEPQDSTSSEQADPAQSETTIFVSPATVNASVGEHFFIYINISDVVDLYGWEFKLGWNASLLEVVSVEEGGFLKSGGETFFSEKINNTDGYVHLACTLLGDVSGVNGSGILAIIEFHVKATGECVLDLYDTALGDSNLQPIVHVANDGYGYFVEETVESGGGRSRPPMPT